MSARIRSRSALAVCVCACFGFAMAPGISHAAINVTPGFTSDVVANDGNCGLREAVIAANTDTASGAMTGECPGGESAVSVPAGNFMLTISGPDEDASANGDLDLINFTTIDGVGPASTTITQTVSGQRVIHIRPNQAPVSLTDISITGGSLSGSVGTLMGAGVFMDGDTNMSSSRDLQNVRIFGNVIGAGSAAVGQGAGVAASLPGAATLLGLADVTVENNDTTGPTTGAGVYSASGLAMEQSRVTGNDASGASVQGGGVWAADAGIVRSVIDDNSVEALSAALNSEGALGGGLYLTGFSSTVTHSTIAGNDVSASASGRSFGGGVFIDAPSATTTLTNVTVSGNTQSGGAADYAGGGGIAATGGGGTTDLRFVSLADNAGMPASAVASLGGRNVRLRASAIDSATPATACGSLASGPFSGGIFTSLGANAGVGTSCNLVAAEDAQGLAAGALALAALADSTGGAASFQAGAAGSKVPVTTRRPSATSPVLNRASSCMGVMDDARGGGRPQGPACDAGAVELEYRTLTVTVSGTGQGFVNGTGISCPGDCTEAVLLGTVIGLTPAPAAGSQFTGWSGACAGTGACNITVDANKSVDAQFGPAGSTPPPTGTTPAAPLPPKKCKKGFKRKKGKCVKKKRKKKR